ncbi:hypothetical protein [Streptomyces sp. NPDC052496]|uniref:hypothetical protein n=1 Tax=Streptomyces sp. NPDC052496 TaxID=3154951 RepID=UPI0034476A86
MSRHQVEIKSDGPYHHQVLIDGANIAHALSGLTLHMRSCMVPRLELDVQLVDVTQLGSVEAEVVLGAGVTDMLTALGWTPPEGHEP